MPRPRHPIREHFTEVPGSTHKNGTIRCNYCGREQSAGNPKRCQKHLDECPQYAQVLAAIDAGRPISFPAHSPFDATGQRADGSNGPPEHAGSPSTPMHHGPGSVQSSPFPNIDRMSEEQVRQTLRLDEQLYLEIERELDAQMMSLNISGAGLLTQGGRMLLKQAFFEINQQWPGIFNEVPEQDKTHALISMAYIANRKRRNGQPPNAAVPKRRPLGPPTPQTPASAAGYPHPPASRPPPPPVSSVPIMRQPAGPLGSTNIIAERAEPGGSFVICRAVDLIEEPKEVDDITVNDLKFMPFISLLQHDDDVMFNAGNDDRIVHTFVGGRQKTVSNEVVWRVAIEEMHSHGANPLVFKIFKRHTAGGI